MQAGFSGGVGVLTRSGDLRTPFDAGFARKTPAPRASRSAPQFPEIEVRPNLTLHPAR
jgi:hypothetical protein